MNHLRVSASRGWLRPTCLLCGVEILPTDDPLMPGEHHGLYKPDRPRLCEPHKGGEGRAEKFIVSAYEVEDVYDLDKFPQLWCCFYRAIIKDSPTEYRVTGVNTFQTENLPGPFYAVNDPTKARIDAKQKSQYHDEAFTQFYDGDSRKPPRILLFEDKPLGYFVHTHCWELLGQVEGPGLKDINLAELAQTYQSYWSHRCRWAGIDTCVTCPFKPKLDMGGHTGKPKVPESPFFVPEIQEAINSAKREGDHLPSILNILPSELVIVIAEYVCPVGDYTVENVQDLGNMLLAFGWELPASFWRKRLDEGFFFELEKLPGNSSVAWKARLNLMCLATDPNSLLISGLVNRERLLRIMLSLKKPEASTTFEGRHGNRGCVNFLPNPVI